jgi:hypothetical protein
MYDEKVENLVKNPDFREIDGIAGSDIGWGPADTYTGQAGRSRSKGDLKHDSGYSCSPHIG